MSAEELERLARAHGLRLLVQFGSTVTGLAHERSDVDLAVLLERPARLVAPRHRVLARLGLEATW